MGKALYRKYRPKKLDDVVGQEHITTTLNNALKKGAISHAYLFTGPRGVGKTSIARILAHTINDIDYQDESIHLDIIEIDAASNRRIDEIRDLRDKVHIAPASAKYKVYIIDEVHMLTREAFNALLKTLEEPPEHAVFILATTEAHKVPETIISRTQRFTFKPIEQSKAVSHIESIAKKEGLKIDRDALGLLAEHGQGSFRDSISMLDQLAGLAKDNVTIDDVRMLLGVPAGELIEKIIETVANNDTQALFKNIQSLREQGIDSGRAALAVSELLRNQLMNSELRISREKTLSLLKQLLTLTTSSNDFLGLELALLEVMSSETASTKELTKPVQNTPAPRTKDEAVKNKSEPVIEKTPSKNNVNDETNEDKKEEQQKEAKTPKIQVEFNNDTWTELLNDLKKKHNTLYGVLRMATPEQDQKTIILSFGFDFHKKQVDNPKNVSIIRDYLRDYFGVHDYSTKVSKNLSKTPEPSTPTPQKSESVDAVANVSNIFGSAELLD